MYLYSNEKDKKEKAISVIDTYDCYASTQVLNELSNVLLRKLKIPVETIKSIIEEVCENCTVTIVDIEDINLALDISNRYQFSYYDSLMLSAAIR